MKKPYPKSNHLSLRLCLLFLLFTVAVIYGCRKEIMKNDNSPSAVALVKNGIDITMLQNVYNKGVNDSKLKAASTQVFDIISNMNVDWTTYSLYTFADSTQIIEFAMPDDKSLLMPDAITTGDSSK